ETAIEDEIAELIDVAEETEPEPDAMFDHVYADLPPRLQEQREYFGALRERHDEDALLQDE
ncbi:MAG: pyruvate dehydrogenase (acetyl-transferring) E1 component subunit alpha, partial [Halobacteriales archaeon]